MTSNFGNLLAQKLNKDYMLFSASKEISEFIEFKNDSVLIRKPYYMSHGYWIANLQKTNHKDNIYKDNIYREYKYNKQNNIVTIYQFEGSKNVEFIMNSNKYFENSENQTVYVLRSFYENNPDVAVIYKNEIFWLDSPETSNGIIRKNGKKNRKLARIMRKKDTDSLNFEIYKGYKAFEKFGYKFVFGIIEVTEKK